MFPELLEKIKPHFLQKQQHRLVSAPYSDTRQITRHICISQYELSYYNTKNICLYVCMLISPQTPATPSVAQQLNVIILIFFIIFMFKVTTLLCVTLHHFTNELIKSNWVYLRTLCKVFNVKRWLIFLMYLMHCKLLEVQVIDMLYLKVHESATMNLLLLSNIDLWSLMNYYGSFFKTDISYFIIIIYFKLNCSTLF